MRRATPTLMLAAALVAHAANLTAQDRAYRIAGQVVDTSGAPAVGVRVCAYPIEGGPSFGASCTRSGNEGSFVLDTRAGGRHQVMAEDPDGGHLSQRRPFYRAPGLPVVDLFLDDRTPSATVTVVLAPKNGMLLLRAADAETGWPLAADPQVCFVSDERRDDGVYTLAAPHVPFTLDALTPEHERWRDPSHGRSGAPLIIASGETLETTMQLARKPAFRGVALTDQEKQQGVHLPAPPQAAPLPAGTSNTFTFIGAQPGRWRVFAVDAQGRPGFKSPWRVFVHER